MRCEVCGEEIRGKPHRRIIEGGKMTVCGRCASFGSADWTPNKPQRRLRRTRRQPRRPRSDVEAAEVMELVSDYGVLIRKARRGKDWTVEDFAKEIQEKESVIKKLEKEDLNPDEKLIRKLEAALSIKLLEAAEPTAAPVTRRASTGRTLGDIWKLSQTEEEEEKN
ncbi:MAG: multiprotein bridging factor aMBF1 [Candidatus Bathyarchaeota archaeon]|jgi:putative transcription factor